MRRDNAKRAGVAAVALRTHERVSASKDCHVETMSAARRNEGLERCQRIGFEKKVFSDWCPLCGLLLIETSLLISWWYYISPPLKIKREKNILYHDCRVFSS
ncbi:hypothetical protein BSKO_08928 [Bryopsis sp. KO-2023]|nr:hypothetical protein BSKO_08928 [Bryopsis sp. KO-2023]